MYRKAVGMLLIVLAISLLCVIATTVEASPSTRVYVDPPEIIDETLLPNKTFIIAVKVENILADPGVVGVEFKLTWDPAILTGVNMTEVLFHSTMPNETEISENLWPLKHEVTTDYVWYAYTYTNIARAVSNGYAPISGNHTIALIALQVKGIGSCILNLAVSKLGGRGGVFIEHEVSNGYFRNSPPPPPALLYVDPPKILDLNLTPCTNFTVNINIANATGLYALEFKLAFDPSMLHANRVDPGDFIPPSATPTVEINNTAGFLSFSVTFGASLDGNGTIAIPSFHVEGLGATPLHLYAAMLADSTGRPLPYRLSDGSFNNILLAKLAVEPAEIIDPSLLPPSTFYINITIGDVEGLYGYEFNLTFDPSVITCLQVDVKDLLNETNYTPNQIINNLHGFIWVNVTYYPPASPLTIYPPTPMVTIKFRVKALGSTNFTLIGISLVDQLGQPIPYEKFDGYFCTLIRDIAIKAVTPWATELYEGQKVNITVTVRNEGNISETFNIAVYNNNTLMGTIVVVNLASGESINKTITWNTTGVIPGLYRIRAEVPPVPYEFDTTDNLFIDGVLKVKIKGDINGDDFVDIFDALLASEAFGTSPGSPRWNPACDLNGDNVVDIFDLIILAQNFGKAL